MLFVLVFKDKLYSIGILLLIAIISEILSKFSQCIIFINYYINLET
jgi:hypothetical protein